MDRPAEVRQVVSVLVRRAPGSVGITAAIQGEGGFGKTTVAELVGSDRRVLRRYRGRVFWVILGRDARSPAEITAKVNNLIAQIDEDRAAVFTDPDQAGQHLAALLAERRRLVILDDVWYPEQERAFPTGGDSARLITTRVSSLVAGRGISIKVDQFTHEQAIRLLATDLPAASLPPRVVAELIAETGSWPLLLRLINRFLVAQATAGRAVPEAAEALLNHFRTHDGGAVQIDTFTGAATAGLNINDPRQRAKAVTATIEASAGLLAPSERARLRELAVFVEDETIPVELVSQLWQRTSDLDPLAAPSLLTRLQDLALISWGPADTGTITLHDVVRDYLRQELGPDALRALHATLLATASSDLPDAEALTSSSHTGPAWWSLPDTARYLYDHLIGHIRDSGHGDAAETLATDLRWLTARLDHAGPLAPLTDLAVISTSLTTRLRRVFGQMVHLLSPTDPAHSLVDILYSRAAHDPHWSPQAALLSARRTDRRLINHWPLPDVPHPAHIRTIAGAAWKVAIAPDGTWLAITSRMTVRLCNSVTGENFAILTGHARSVTGVAIAPDGTWLATASEDNTVRLWDRTTGRCTATLTTDNDQMFVGVAIAPDGTWLATTSFSFSGEPPSGQLWDRATGKRTATLSRGWGLAIAPDGAWLATTFGGATHLWDGATAEWISTFTGPPNRASAVAIAPDGTWLATAEDKTVQLLDRVTGQCTATLTGHTNEVTGVAIAPDGTWLATTSQDKTVRLWDYPTGRCTATFTGHTDVVTGVAIAPDGTWLATASSDETVQLWDPAAAGQASTSPSGPVTSVQDVAIAPDGTWLAVAESTTVRLLDRVTGQCTATLAGHTGGVTAVAIAPNGDWLATASEDTTVRLWDRVTGQCTTLTGHKNIVTGVAIAPDSTWLAVTSQGTTVPLFDRASGQCTAILTGHIRGVNAVAIAPDGTWLATASEDTTVRLWDLATGQCTAALPGHIHGMTSVAIAPDGSWLAATSDTTVRLWNHVTGECFATLTGHTREVTSVSIAPNGTWLATTSEDKTVRLWNHATKECIAIQRVEAECHVCQWSSNGQWLAVAGSKGAYLFDVRSE